MKEYHKIETLFVRDMEDYLMHVEMRHAAKDPVAHMEESRQHWEKLKDFFLSSLTAVREAEREKLRKVVEFAVGCCKWLPEASKFSKEAMVRRHNSDLDYILSHLQEPTASRAKEALVKSAEGRLEVNPTKE